MKKIVLFAVLATALMLSPAMADKGNGHGKGKGKGHHAEKHEKAEPTHERQWNDHNDSDRVYIQIDLGDRDAISSYLRKHHGKSCPPGLAKKHNGCLPPGQAKKYKIGNTLPDDVVWKSLPDDLLSVLRPAPRGYRYVSVDKDVLLIAEATKKVIDAVTLYSAVGQ